MLVEKRNKFKVLTLPYSERPVHAQIQISFRHVRCSVHDNLVVGRPNTQPNIRAYTETLKHHVQGQSDDRQTNTDRFQIVFVHFPFHAARFRFFDFNQFFTDDRLLTVHVRRTRPFSYAPFAAVG